MFLKGSNWVGFVLGIDLITSTTINYDFRKDKKRKIVEYLCTNGSKVIYEFCDSYHQHLLAVISIASMGNKLDEIHIILLELNSVMSNTCTTG